MFRPFVGFCLPIGLVLTGCGWGGAASLSDVDIAAAIAAPSVYCVQVATGKVTGDAPTADYADVTRGVQELIDLARRSPDYMYNGRTMRQVLSDQATDMRACDNAAADQLELAVTTL